MRLATGTARGLLQLHVIEHIIHGNLTASNILVDASAYPIISAQVSDYGLARLMTPAAISNVLIATAGSTGYRAPELDKTKKPSTKSDVYSFGIVLLELLTGTSYVLPE
jgi:serine/threonine protein kinase